MDFLRQETISYFTSPLGVFNFIFKGSIPPGAIMKWWPSISLSRGGGMEGCWASNSSWWCFVLLKPRYSLIKFLLCGPHQLVLTLQAPRVSNINFLLSLSGQCINKREAYENKQNDHSRGKCFISFINKCSLLILWGGVWRSVWRLTVTLYLHVVV